MPAERKRLYDRSGQILEQIATRIQIVEVQVEERSRWWFGAQLAGSGQKFQLFLTDFLCVKGKRVIYGKRWQNEAEDLKRRLTEIVDSKTRKGTNEIG